MAANIHCHTALVFQDPWLTYVDNCIIPSHELGSEPADEAGGFCEDEAECGESEPETDDEIIPESVTNETRPNDPPAANDTVKETHYMFWNICYFPCTGDYCARNT